MGYRLDGHEVMAGKIIEAMPVLVVVLERPVMAEVRGSATSTMTVHGFAGRGQRRYDRHSILHKLRLESERRTYLFYS